MTSFFTKQFNPSTDLPDLTGKVAIVTGGNSGIGYATIKHLARKGAKVYMASRSQPKALQAIENLESEGLGPGHGKVVFLQLDLKDARNAKKAAEEFLSKEDRLDILVNNAAVHFLPYEITSDGISNITVVNHISPFVFTHHLLPILKRTAQEPTADVRIVTVGWIQHRLVPSWVRFRNLDDLNQEFADAGPLAAPAYARCQLTKLENLLWMRELQKRLDKEGAPIIAITIDPGDVNTYSDRLHGRWAFLKRIYMYFFFQSWDKGAYNSVIAAGLPEIRQNPEKYKGGYMEGGNNGSLAEPSELAKNDSLAAELWETTERFVQSIGLY